MCIKICSPFTVFFFRLESFLEKLVENEPELVDEWLRTYNRF